MNNDKKIFTFLGMLLFKLMKSNRICHVIKKTQRNINSVLRMLENSYRFTSDKMLTLETSCTDFKHLFIEIFPKFDSYTHFEFII